MWSLKLTDKNGGIFTNQGD